MSVRHPLQGSLRLRRQHSNLLGYDFQMPSLQPERPVGRNIVGVFRGNERRELAGSRPGALIKRIDAMNFSKGRDAPAFPRWLSIVYESGMLSRRQVGR